MKDPELQAQLFAQSVTPVYERPSEITVRMAKEVEMFTALINRAYQFQSEFTRWFATISPLSLLMRAFSLVQPALIGLALVSALKRSTCQ